MSIRIRISAGSTLVLATLHDNATARDLAALLPLDVSLEDYADTEKIAYMPRKLAVTDAPPGATPAVGDLAYYAPWGNLAFFHKPDDYAPGLVRIGSVDRGLEFLRQPGRVVVKLEREEP